MTFRLSARSEARLVGVHPDLVRVVRRAIVITTVDFAVFEGVRTLERQRELYARGASRTMNSRHLTGHAVDLVAWVPDPRTGKPGLSWASEHYAAIAEAMSEAAYPPTGPYVPLEWGGSWPWFKDLAHFQLPWRLYPAK